MKKRKILLIVFIILSIGLLMVYSSSHIWAQYKENDSFYYFKRQAIFVIVGLLLLFFFSKIDYHLYQKHSLKIIILATILLVLVLIPGVGIVRGGSRSWFNLGLFALQPSEIYKIALIIYVSDYISHHYHQMKKLRYCLKPLIVMGIGFFLIMLQPDFGSGFVMCCSILLMIIITPFPFRYIIFLGLSGILMIILMIISAPYRMKRIFAFLDPFQDPLGSGFQMIQSLYAIIPSESFIYFICYIWKLATKIWSWTVGKTIDQLTREVISGKWGNGEERKRRLTQAGYDYRAVQRRVNELI